MALPASYVNTWLLLTSGRLLFVPAITAHVAQAPFLPSSHGSSGCERIDYASLYPGTEGEKGEVDPPEGMILHKLHVEPGNSKNRVDITFFADGCEWDYTFSR